MSFSAAAHHRAAPRDHHRAHHRVCSQEMVAEFIVWLELSDRSGDQAPSCSCGSSLRLKLAMDLARALTQADPGPSPDAARMQLEL